MKDIKIGDRIEIMQPDINSKDKAYVSQVENILDQDQLVIHMPIYYGQLIKLAINKTYKFLFFTDKAIVEFNTEILKHTAEEGFNLTVIKLLDKGKKVQRREFFRFTCLIDATFVVTENDEVANEDQSAPFTGIIKDIGAGGIRFVSNINLEENTIIKSSFPIMQQTMTNTGRIVCKQYIPDANYTYQYRVEFIDIGEDKQEMIIQFIFSEERKILQKLKA